jgi:TRAP-type transport system small permease protein
MQRMIDYLFRPLEVVIVVLLAAMVIMVFGNVVLRYGFNTGIVVSEEMSRYLFVWLTFIGAVVTFRENAHMGVETLVRQFPRNGRLICMVASNVIIFFCAAVFFWGTWKQAPINASMTAPVTGLPMIWVYGIGFFTGGAMAIIALIRIVRVLTGYVTDEEIASFAGEFTTPARERAE